MADPISIEQALVALKKGTQLIKYSRKGKPKFRSFRVSPDEKALCWYSHGDEKSLKFSGVSQILPGQRTAVFKRHRSPEKEYLSFSLLYNNGQRSLDLICKDQLELDVWLAGLNSLISTCKTRRRRTQSDISDLQASGDFLKDASQVGATVRPARITRCNRLSVDFTLNEPLLQTPPTSDVGSGRTNMQVRTSSADGFRLSVSSTPSCSSAGSSGQDDIESLGDVYMWGSIWYDTSSTDGSAISLPKRTDVLFPKILESNVVLDVHQIACGVRHVALVTRQGEVFTWGEESGGRLGHGIERNQGRPLLVEFLAVTSVDFVACGEHHTCAVSSSGDFYTWGDGTLSPGLLGNGSDVSHWIPKRISGPLEGIQVLSVACGNWHSALIATNGKLYTFGEGMFGALGHGNRDTVSFPKEVQLLSGLKTIKVACGVWHTAAIVDLSNQYGSNVLQRKLFTWGDGEKYRLGHGNKDAYLLPACVSPLIDYNLVQLACGDCLTVTLTTSGHVFTFGSTAYGQLGNPQSDGKLPCLVQDRLVGEFVEEIACGACHVAVITSRSELFTWGRGTNGRLGHGDVEDRNTPTLVEALKDKHVKSISCGSNYTSTVCVRKWVTGQDQSVCSGCRQAFGFTRKRHNCYNCGLVHCHGCSSKKALKAALAPTPGKPHRVCDSCFIKLKKGPDVSNLHNQSVKGSIATPPRPINYMGETRTSRLLLAPVRKPMKYFEAKAGKSTGTHSQAPSTVQIKDISFPSSLNAIQNALKPAVVPPSPPPSPPPPQHHPLYSSRPTGPRSATPAFPRGVIDGLKKTNEQLSQEVNRLRNEVKSLRQKSELQDAEIKKVQKSAQDAARFAAMISSRCSFTTEVIKLITTELKEMEEKLPPEISDGESFKAMRSQAESVLDSDQSEASISNYLPPELVSIFQNSRESIHIQFYKMDDEGDADSSPTVDNGPHEALDDGAEKLEGRKEVIEQFEPGVYVTLLDLGNGYKIFKRVKFSKRRFRGHEAEEWWKENKERLLKEYSPPPKMNNNNTQTAATPDADDNDEAS